MGGYIGIMENGNYYSIPCIHLQSRSRFVRRLGGPEREVAHFGLEPNSPQGSDSGPAMQGFGVKKVLTLR